MRAECQATIAGISHIDLVTPKWAPPLAADIPPPTPYRVKLLLSAHETMAFPYVRPVVTAISHGTLLRFPTIPTYITNPPCYVKAHSYAHSRPFIHLISEHSVRLVEFPDGINGHRR